MVHRYRFGNFFCFREETEVSFLLTRHAPGDTRTVICPTGQRLSKALAVIGANGSGKTCLIKPLAFLGWFVRDSFRSEPDAKIPLEPHFFSTEPLSRFEVEFDWDNMLWRYQLAATPERVISEALFRKTSRLFSYVFIREWEDNKKTYSIRQQGFGFHPREAAKVRENASLISTAAQYDVPLAREMVNLAVYTNVHFGGRHHLGLDQVMHASGFYAERPALQRRMASLLKAWDFGLMDVDIRKVPITKPTGETEDILVPYGLHQAGTKRAELPLFQESSGTQGAFVQLSRLLPALESGGLAVIDEMESDLHPHMLVPILDLFFNEESNPHNAQIIFTCHSMEILNLLHKGQVILVQKDQHCESEAWRLYEMQGVRSDDNLYAKYMAGTYGAVPTL